MAATNIFYRLPSQRGTRIASIAGTECNLDQFCKHIIDIEGLNRQDFIIAIGTRVFRPSSCQLQTISIRNNANVDILIPLLGGKGGFGSLLRAIGAQIEKTTNRDACRDLSGRRLRDIKREDELRKLLELKEKLEEERRERRREKIEKLKKQSEKSQTSASIQELVSMFDDHAYNKRRMELGEILDAAVEKGLINAKRRLEDGAEGIKKCKVEVSPDTDKANRNLLESSAACEKTKLNNNNSPNRSQCTQEGENEDSRKLKSIPKKKDLWLGLESDDDNLDEGTDDDESDQIHSSGIVAAQR